VILYVQMFVYELHKNAGTVNYKDWYDKGIVVPVFDIDGTLTEHQSTELDQKVIGGLNKQCFRDLYPEIAIANNYDLDHVKLVAKKAEAQLGVKALIVSIGEGYIRKPHPIMGQVVANYFDILPEQIGVVGDRRISDVTFGRKLGAGAIALCAKVGEGDAPFVGFVRELEAIKVFLDRIGGSALLND